MTNRYVRLLASLLLVLTFSSCTRDAGETYSPQTIDTLQLGAAFVQARRIGGQKSLVVVRGGTFRREEYYGTGGADSLHDVRSVTKSLVSLLIGIAVDKGYIPTIEQALGDYVRPLVDSLPPEKANIKLRHLLTMSCGLQWGEFAHPDEYDEWIHAPDQIQYILDKQSVAQPGQTFDYNSGATHLLSVVLSQATGMRTVEFAQRYLFDSLNIGPRGWLADNRGYNNGGAGLSITPNDMVKIGELVLNRGTHAGRRVVSSDWIDRSTQFHIVTNNAVPYGTGYGYSWWLGNAQGRDMVFAMGWGGQFIIIVPSVQLVVVATSEWRGLSSSAANQQWSQVIDNIVNRVVPAFH